MSSAAIRAGAAFVEILIKDESVRASLENTKVELRTFGRAVDSVGSGSFAAMQTAGTASLVTTGASVGVLAATMGVLKAGVYAVGNAFRVTFNMITTSVTRAVLGLGLIGLAVARFAPKGGRIAGYLNSFLSKSQTTEAIGRWTRFAGAITGSSALKGIGNQIERLGLGSAIVKGFRGGGLLGGIGATFGAAFRSSKSIVASGIISLFAAPIGIVRGMLGSVTGGIGGGGGGPLKAIAASSGGVATGLAKATGAATTFGATTSIFGRVATAVRGLLIKVGGLAAAITGPALLAAKKFVTSSEEIIAASKKTGDEFVSIQDGIANKFGGNSLISEADIRAGAALGATMTELKQAMAAAWAQIGAAALPVLKGLTENLLWAAQSITQLLGRNRELIATVISVAAKVGSAAAAGLALYTVFPYLVAGVGMLLSPLGLLAAGVIAVAVAFPKLREEATGVFSFLFGSFGELGTIVSETMGGIADALAGGNLTSAARVLWAGLNLAWLAGTEQLRAVWREVTTSLVKFGVNFVADTISVFTQLWNALESGFATAFNAIGKAWRTTQNYIAGGVARVLAKLTGQSVDDVLATLNEMQQAEAKAGANTIEAGNAARVAAAKQRLAEIEEQRKLMLESVDDEAKARAAMADAALQAARDEFAAARAEAAALRPKSAAKADEDKAALGASSSLGTFSTAALGRQSIGGLSLLQKSADETAKNTEQTVAALENLKLQWS